MAGTLLGTGKYTYEPAEGWGKLPDGWRYVEVAGVDVDSKDNVYLITRGEHPVIVFDREGNFLRSWGEGLFSRRTHAIHVGPDDSVYCTDDGDHTIRKFTPEGKLLLTIGNPNQPSKRFSGLPFNRPTHVALSPFTNDIYVSDGYNNARVHKYSPDGRLLFSWGEPGIGPGQFFIPHNIATDAQDRVYVADRENHRIQVFDSKGKFLTMWNNIYRPCGLHMSRGSDQLLYIGELSAPIGYKDAPSLGHRVDILNLDGQMLCQFGDPYEGEGPGQLIGPHGVCTDSRGDIYVGEVSYTVRGSHENPPREMRSFQKFIRKE
jgi:DNA-binding beta-propeller fold protein YncE